MDQVEEVKRKSDIVEVVGQYVQLKTAGRNLKGLCPFHGEKTPSFMVNPELQIYKCFGCSKGGDVINFVEEIEGVEFKEALGMLAEKVGVQLHFSKENSKEKSEKEKMIEVHELSSNYYSFLLRKHEVGKEAREYLKERGVSEKLMETFRLGFAMKSWDGLRKFLVNKKGFSEKMLERAGLLIASDRGGYDRFRNRVMFPLQDYRGRVVGFSGRLMPGGTEKDGAKYVNSSESLIYHKSEMLYGYYQAKKAIRERDQVVLVEGQMDVVSSFGAGIGETVAIGGTALTEEQIDLIGRLTKNLILALDADEAGSSATRRSIELSEKKGMNIKVVLYKEGKDPDEIVQKDPKRWKRMVEEAVDVYEYFLQKAVKKHGVTGVDAKRKVSEEVIPVLSKLSNQVILGHYIKRLSDLLQVREESVVEEIARIRRGSQLSNEGDSGEKDEVAKKGRKEEIEGLIMAYAMRVGRDTRERVLKRIRKTEKEELYKALSELWSHKGEVSEWVKRQGEWLKDAFMMELDEDRIERGLWEAVEEWEKLINRVRLLDLRNKLADAERNKDKERLEEIKGEIVDLTRKMA